jgi:hypothetical protein
MVWALLRCLIVADYLNDYTLRTASPRTLQPRFLFLFLTPSTSTVVPSALNEAINEENVKNSNTETVKLRRKTKFESIPSEKSRVIPSARRGNWRMVSAHRPLPQQLLLCLYSGFLDAQ